jgi:hypothetical protein
MKNSIKRFLALFTLSMVFSGFYLPTETTLGAENPVTGFEVVITPTTARVNEALDVTVKAIDKNKNVVTGYRWSIIFVSQNMSDTVPSPGKSIAFTAEDLWQKKFSKGVIFKNTGKQKIYISDTIDDIIGEAEINVEAASPVTTSGGEIIKIITPENASKVATDVVVVSWNTRKNSKVTLLLNGNVVGNVVTDGNGLFTYSLSGITQTQNILKVSLVDSENGSIVAQSDDIRFEKTAASTGFYNLIIQPGTTVEASSKIQLTAEAEPAMNAVFIELDGSSIEAKEKEAGKYHVETVAPNKPGTYTLAVNLKNSLGQSQRKENVGSLTTTAPVAIPQEKSVFENVKIVTNDTKVIFTFWVKNPPKDLYKFKIAYGANAESFTEETVTYNTGKIIQTWWLYTWYIDKIKPQVYTFKILGLKEDGSLVIPELSSDPININIWKASCTIGNVGNIDIKTLSDKTILSWKSVTWALSYNIYTLSPSGDSTFFENTKDTNYTIFLSSGSTASYKDFGIKALCDEKTESADISKASHVKTGPQILALLVIIAGFISIVIMRRKYSSY